MFSGIHYDLCVHVDSQLIFAFSVSFVDGVDNFRNWFEFDTLGHIYYLLFFFLYLVTFLSLDAVLYVVFSYANHFVLCHCSVKSALSFLHVSQSPHHNSPVPFSANRTSPQRKPEVT